MDVLTFVMTFALVYVASNYYQQPAPTIDWEAINNVTWWGAGDEASQDTGIYPTEITWSDEMIADLKKRLARNVSYVAPLEDAAFTYGFNRDQLANWTTYWGQQYDFASRLKALNQYPMYKTNIQGLDIFYIHISPEPLDPYVERVPVLLLHGFPSSVREFYEAIPLLTAYSFERNYVLELIIPSLPGFGYSDAAVKPGFGGVQMAVVFRNLMQRLGYSNYYVAAGDWGSIIGGHMATLYPEEVLGFYTNWLRVLSPMAVLLQIVGSLYPSFLVTPETYDRAYPVYDVFKSTMNNIAYLHWQATKPGTAGVPMTDSPAGLLAYLLENIAIATDRTSVEASDGHLYSKFSQETMIDNLMFYWAPTSIDSAFRLYAEGFSIAQMSLRMDEIPTQVPVWGIQQKYAPAYQPELIIKLKYPNLLNATVLDYGGNYLALELPEVYSENLLTAISGFREWRAWNSFPNL